MRRIKPVANPSRLLKIKKMFENKEITEKEMLQMRKEALSTNVYTGKVRTNEPRIQNTGVLRFENSK